MDIQDPFRVLDLVITYRAVDEINLPFFKGNSLRTALGKAIKSVVCITPLKSDCNGCALETLCVYRQLFPQKDKLRNTHGASIPYMAFFSEDTPGVIPVDGLFSLSLKLFGIAVPLYPYFYLGLERMGYKGIGNKDKSGKRGKAVLEKVEEQKLDGKSKCLFSGNANVRTWEPEGFRLSDYINEDISCLHLLLTTLSPLRLKYRNMLNHACDFHILLRSCLRRYESLYALTTGDKPPIPWKELIEKASSVKVISEDVNWKDYHRYSSRQRSDMFLGGIDGSWEYEGELGDMYPYLKIGELLGIGKGISFGFGRFVLTRKEA